MNRVEVVDGGEGFDLGDDGEVAAGVGDGFAGHVEVGAVADEGEGEEVEAVADGEASVDAVGVGDGWAGAVRRRGRGVQRASG